MSLSGSLRDFGLAQVLQLLAQQGRHGVLRVVDRTRAMRLFFAQGHLVGVSEAHGELDAMLLPALVQGELVTPEILERAASQPRQPGELVSDILLQTGAVEAGLLLQLTQLQTKETLLELLLLEDGSYIFEASTSAPPMRHTPLRVETLLLGMLEQTTLLRSLRRRIPTLMRVFKTSGSLEEALTRQDGVNSVGLKRENQNYGDQFGLLPADDSWGDVAATALSTQTLGHPERLVFSLLDGHRTLRQVTYLSRLGELAVLAAICHLEDAKLVVEVSRASAPSIQTGPQKSWRERVHTWVFNTALVVGWALCVALVAQSGLSVEASTPRQQGFIYRASAARILAWEAATPAIMARKAVEEALIGQPVTNLRDVLSEAPWAPGYGLAWQDMPNCLQESGDGSLCRPLD